MVAQPLLVTILMLAVSNLFMTFASYTMRNTCLINKLNIKQYKSARQVRSSLAL